MEVLPRVARIGATRLDLDEDQHLAVVAHKVELAVAGPVVAGEDLKPEALEVLGRQVLAPLAGHLPEVCHGRRRYGRPL